MDDPNCVYWIVSTAWNCINPLQKRLTEIGSPIKSKQGSIQWTFVSYFYKLRVAIFCNIYRWAFSFDVLSKNRKDIPEKFGHGRPKLTGLNLVKNCLIHKNQYTKWQDLLVNYKYTNLWICNKHGWSSLNRVQSKETKSRMSTSIFDWRVKRGRKEFCYFRSNRCRSIKSALRKVSCHMPFTHAFTALCCNIKVIMLVTEP